MHQVLPDTSCLILFRKIGQLDLLYEVYGRLFITPEVLEEYRKGLPEWIKVKPLKNRTSFHSNRKIVDYGEASIITLAMEISSPLLIIDDKRGRKLANALNIPLSGTLGTVLKAKKIGVIKSVKPVLENLKAIDFRISDELEAFILREAKE